MNAFIIKIKQLAVSYKGPFPYVNRIQDNCVLTFTTKTVWCAQFETQSLRHYDDGTIRFGTFDVDGQQQGIGSKRLSNGSAYEGYFKNHLPHGIGFFHYNDNVILFCEGVWVTGELQGYVKIIYANKDIYIGNFSHGKPHGRGEMKYSSSKVFYSGDWVHGIATGTGTITFSNGGKYVGECVNGVPHGYGCSVNAHGNIRYGEWIHGTKQKPRPVSPPPGLQPVTLGAFISPIKVNSKALKGFLNLESYSDNTILNAIDKILIK